MYHEKLKASHRRRDWRECIALADKALHESIRLEEPARRENTASSLVRYGDALKQTGEVDLARASFELAVETDPQNQEGYIQWASLEAQAGNRPMARRIVRAGLRRVGGAAELQMFADGDIDRPTLSACMIVKNEEEFLANCLESIRDICDEIIVVDTGSEDGTVAIAESFGCKVFHQPWEGDFSKHRNYSLEQASGDWILIIDADEELNPEEWQELKQSLNQDQYPIISVTVYNLATRTGQGTTFLPSVRLFRRELGLKYDGIVHNRLLFPVDTPQLRAPIQIIHHGYDLSPEQMRKKHKRSRELLQKQIAAEPDNYFAHFNMAQLVRAQTNFATEADADLTLKHARKVIELADKEDLNEFPFLVMAHHQAATALYAKHDLAAAERHCWTALQLKPHYIDAILALGYIYLKSERLAEAERMFKEYLEQQEAFVEHTVSDGMIIIHLKSRHNALYNLGLIAERHNDWSAAARYFHAAHAENPEFMDSKGREGWALLKTGEKGLARERLMEQEALSAEFPILYLGLAELSLQEGDETGAERELRRGIPMVRDPGMLYARLVDALAQAGRVADARAAADEGLGASPGCALLHAAFASVCLREENTAKALSEYQEAERLAPGDSSVALGMANAFFVAGEFVQSTRWYAVALERDPNLAWAKRNLAVALTRLGKYEEAESHMRAYVELAPEDRQARAIYGALLLETGEGQAALAMFERLALENPDDPETLLALSDCYLRLGSFASARAGYERLLERNPNDSIARARLDAIKSKTR